MKNVKELRDNLIDLYSNVRDENIDIEKAKVMVSAGNSIIKSAAIELEHSKFTGKKKQIDFLKTD
jgi:hypothetical protein